MAFSDWSTVAANNATKPGINWAEGQTPASINDSARQMMADLAALAGLGIGLPGRTAAIAGSKAKIDVLYDHTSLLLEDEGGIWNGAVHIRHGFNWAFDNTTGGANAPVTTLFARAVNNGSAADVCGAILDAVANVNNASVFGANIIARGTGKSGCKYVGLEIDVEPAAGDTAVSSASGGLFINVFSVVVPGPAIMTGAVSGGTFNNGVVLGGLATNAAGLSLQSSASADSLVNGTVGTFTTSAIVLGATNKRGIYFTSGANSSLLWFDGTNMRAVIPTGGSYIFRNPTDTSSVLVVDTGGNVDMQAGGVLKRSGVQVVAGRDTGWTAMTGSPDKATAYATNTVTLQQLAGRVMYIQSALTAHGLIGA